MGVRDLDSGTLFVVATPIGNREDLSPRARQVLADADLVAAEDTRHTGRLLSHFGINTPQIALYDHNEETVVPRLLSALKEGKCVALVSDAGTPLISDPGYRLVCAAHDAGTPVSPVPGASAVTAALSVSGLPTDRFCFEGFLPHKKAARRTRLREIRDETRSMLFFESVHRIKATIADLCEVIGAERNAFIGRELSKIREQCVSSTLGEIREMLDSGQMPAKGEFVLIVGGNRNVDAEMTRITIEQLIKELSAVLPTNQAADLISSLSGKRRNEIYKLILAQRDS